MRLIALFCSTLFVTMSAPCSLAGNPVIAEAERLEAVGAWNEAVTEYERYLYFYPDSPRVEVFRAIARCQGNLGNYTKACLALDRAMVVPSDDAALAALRIEAAAYLIAAGDFPSAELELTRISAFAPTAALRLRAGRYLGLVQCLSMDWPAFSETAGRAGVYDGTERRRIDSVFAHPAARNRVSPVVAKWMSTVVPGLGQAYARDYRNGCNALALSLGTGVLTLYSLMNGYYREALLTDITLFWRYYSGNRWKAQEAAERYNMKHDRAIRDTILAILSGQ